METGNPSNCTIMKDIPNARQCVCVCVYIGLAQALKCIISNIVMTFDTYVAMETINKLMRERVSDSVD